MKGITLFDHAATRFENVSSSCLGNHFQFTEGPVWHPNGYLLFSDTPTNRIYRLSNNQVTVFIDKAGFTGSDDSLLSDQVGPNGLAFDTNGALLVCQHGDHRIAKWEDGLFTPIVASFENRPFNSPNDLRLHSSGSLFFSDPPYGLKDQVLNKNDFQSRAAVHRVRDGIIDVITTELNYPNGLVFSPSNDLLYVSSNHPDEPRLLRFVVDKDGNVGEKHEFMTQNADGLETDQRGNLYMATDDGVLIADPQGHKLALIPLDETPTNMCWEDGKYNVLYVTARSAVYKLTF